MSRTLRMLACVLLAWGTARAPAVPVRAEDARPKATLTAEQIRDGLRLRQRSVRSLYVEYRADDTYRGNARYPVGYYVINIVAAKSPSKFFHLMSHGHDAQDWRDDLYQQTTYITEVETATEKSVDRRYTVRPIKPTDPLPGTMPWEFYFAATGLWPTDGRPTVKVQGRPYMLADIAASDEFRIVRRFLERCGDRWCHVLESPGWMRLWVDAGRGFALAARETIDTKNGALVERIESLDFREFKPGVWLPTRFHNVQYDNHTASDPAARSRKTLDSYLHVWQTRVNDVEDSVFEYRPPPGAVRLGGSSTPTQTAPGGLDLLDDLARWIQAYHLSNDEIRQATRAGTSTGQVGLWAAAAVGLLISLCEAVLLVRRSIGRWLPIAALTPSTLPDPASGILPEANPSHP